MKKMGFNNEKYLELQSKKIKERINLFGGKLYLEFGGKLFDDYHASRVLPGFAHDSKAKMLMQLKNDAEIVIVINANDIENNKQRGDLGITYDLDVLRLIDAFRSIDLYVGSVVITHYEFQHAAKTFESRLQKLGVKTFRHYPIQDYPYNIPLIVSEEGFGKNDYIETSRSLIVVTAPGPGSGKMAICLSQLYHDNKKGTQAGYAKYETFPVWNLPLKHPVNLAYEAATADLNDINMIDPFHLEAYGKMAVNYNRDVEIFPVLKTMFEKIGEGCPYKSPTEMGVNMAGFAIDDDEVVRAASCQEIIRRYYNALCRETQGFLNPSEVHKLELLMNQLGLTAKNRPVIDAANKKAEETNNPAVAIELSDGKIITGKTTPLLGASAAVLLNALKLVAGIDHDIVLISPGVIEPVQKLKVNIMGNRNPRLHTDEVLIALSISATANENAAKALGAISRLRNTEAHSSVILSEVDENVFKTLGIRLTCEPKYQTKKLYHR